MWGSCRRTAVPALGFPIAVPPGAWVPHASPCTGVGRDRGTLLVWFINQVSKILSEEMVVGLENISKPLTPTSMKERLTAPDGCPRPASAVPPSTQMPQTRA